MTEVTQIADAANVAAAREGTHQDGATISHSTGQLALSSDVISVGRDSVVHKSRLATGDLNSFLGRPVEIASGLLSNANTFGIVTQFNPWALFLAKSTVADKLANFSYIRATMNVTFVLSAPGNGYGLYVLSAVPNCGVALGESWLASMGVATENCLQVDFCAPIDIALSSDVALKLPFVSQFDYWSLADAGADWWNCTLNCLQPVGTGVESGVTEAYYKVYAHLTDLELVVPTYQGKVKKFLERADEMKAGAKSLGVSSTAKQISDVASNLSKVPIIGAFATPVAQAAELVGDVASWFGFTRETAEVEPSPIVFRPFSNTAHYDCKDVSELASLSVANAISIDPQIADGTPEDCASFSSLFVRPTLVARVAWNVTDASGAILLQLPVTPGFVRATTDTNIQMTTAGYCGLPFQLWRGDIHYKIFVPCSKLHRGALQIAWAPSNASLTGIDITNVTMNVIREIECGVEWDVTVAYAREKPSLRHEICSSASVINLDEVNGFLYIRVVNPLRSQENTASTNILVFQYASDNMQFSVLRDRFKSILNADNSFYEVQLQGGATGDEAAEQIQFNVVTGESYSTEKIFAGETVSSARAMMQKPSQIFATGTTDITRTLHQGPLILASTTNSVSGARVFTIPQYYRALFIGVAGSERVKILTTSAGANYPISIGPWLPYSGVTEPSGKILDLSPMQWVNSTNGGVEVTVPYYTPRKFSPVMRDFTTTVPNEYRVIRYNRPSGETSDFSLFWCFGPDLRINMFRQVPKFSLSALTFTPTFTSITSV